MYRPELKGLALRNRRVAGVAVCLLALSAAQNQARPFLFSFDEPAPVEVTRSSGDDLTVSPLERHPGRLGYVETANAMPRQSVSAWIGTQQNDPNSAAGTGNQLYFAGIDYAPSRDFEFGFIWQDFSDTLSDPIAGDPAPRLEFQTAAVRAKYRFVDNARLSMAVEGSVEYFSYKSSTFGTLAGPDQDNIIGMVALPLTYEMSPQLQFHVSPGVSVFPDSVAGATFFDVIPHFTAGVSWKPSPRWSVYGHVTVPFGDEGNTIETSGALDNEAVWTVGARYNISPKYGVDLYLTNSFGVTPATRILTFPPDGDTTLLGLRINYFPGFAANYPDTYRGPVQPVTMRAINLQQDGFTLSSGDTIEPGRAELRGGFGTDDNYSISAIFSPDRDGQVEVHYEQWADDGTVGPPTIPSTESRVMAGGKLRLKDQNNGDAFSLSMHALLGRDESDVGVLYLGLPATYQVNETFAVNVNPKFATWGDTETFGLGVGVNYEVFNGLEAIAEFTAVDNDEDAVWAAGVRYNVPGSMLSLDAHATNAIGRYGLGSMTAQSDTKYAIGAKIHFDTGWK